ncbi:MAG: hypothetical protein QOJ42_79, partial [Acidobacteriaceae bacterium]|nr:hypothetical protein [Acidobacteriaceae bacterium]
WPLVEIRISNYVYKANLDIYLP